MALLDYWLEFPPVSELVRGFVGYKPPSKEIRAARHAAETKAVRAQFGSDVSYDQLPQWLRDIHAANKKKEP